MDRQFFKFSRKLQDLRFGTVRSRDNVHLIVVPLVVVTRVSLQIGLVSVGLLDASSLDVVLCDMQQTTNTVIM